MKTTFTLDTEPGSISVQRRVHPRSKRLKLRVDLDGQVIVVVPPGVPDPLIADFLADQVDWVEARLAELADRRQQGPAPNPVRLEDGGEIPLFGDPCRLRVRPAAGKRIHIHRLADGGIGVDVPSGLTGPLRDRRLVRAMERWLKHQVAPIIDYFVEDVSLDLPFRPLEVRLVSPRRRWGSCSTDRRVRLNWRLVFAKEEVTRYVVVHELCHLEHHHHGPEFWAAVERICPKYRVHQRWLRDHAYLIDLLRDGRT